MTTSQAPIIVERAFDHPPGAVWAALTEHERMLGWFFSEIPEFRPEPGFETRFVVSPGERSFTHIWRITAVEPGRSITYDWRYEEYPGVGAVRFEVLGRGVRVTFDGLESFSQDVPEFSRESCEGGWAYFLEQLDRSLTRANMPS